MLREGVEKLARFQKGAGEGRAILPLAQGAER